MRFGLAFTGALALSLVGCSDDPQPRSSDAAIDTDATAGDATAGDAAPADAAPADARPGDGSVEPDAFVPPPGGEPCTSADQCPFGDCIDGACNNERPNRCIENGDADCPEGETCGGFDENYYCVRPCEVTGDCPVRTRPCSTNFDCAAGSSCHAGRCTNNCETDRNCGEAGFCYDGACRPYPQDLWTGAAPRPLGRPGELVAGVATVPLDYPVGVELGGYGDRPGPRNPYAFALGGSDRFFEQQDVRVIVLSDEDDVLIFVRLPLCWSTDLILSNVAQRVQTLTGVNYRDKIVTSATHSHSQPARFWTIVPETGFGVFGHGQFSKEILERVSASVAGAIKAALDDVRPARFGYTIVNDFDPADRIHSDRRGANAPYKDDRMTLWRVDEADGRPRAAVVSFALHGTHMEEPWVTGDAPGGVEVVATQALSAEAGYEVPVLFANGNAGDVSPRGDDGVEQPWGKMQAVGHRAWGVMRDALLGIETRADVDLEVITRRIPITYRDIGYDRAAREFRARPSSAPQIYGGFQCVQGEREPGEPDYEDGQYNCIIDLETFRGAPVPEFMKATLSAFRIGNLVVSTLPGEPTSRLGRDLADAVQRDAAAAGYPDYTATNIGYSQDHHLYLVQPEDWRRGGYEAAQNVWGPKFGNYISAQARALAGELFTPEQEQVDTGIKPTWYDFLPDDAVPPTATMGLPGGLLGAPEGRVERGALMRFVFNGGHPGVDMPYAVLERRREDGAWVPAVRAEGGTVFDNTTFETLTIYEGDFDRDHTWAIAWELPFNAPLGTYRMHLTGRTFDGSDVQPYDVYTPTPFELVPATLALRDARADGGRVQVRVNYPDGPSNDDGVSPFEALTPTGHLLRADPERASPGRSRQYAFMLGRELPTDTPARVELSGPGSAQANLTPTADTVARTLTTSRGADGATTTETIEGWPSATLAIGAPVAGRYTVTVTDAWGNLGSAEVDVP